MIKKTFLSLVCVIAITGFSTNEKEIDTMRFISNRLQTILMNDSNPTKIPRTINKDGNLITVDIYDWTSGFFPGNLWYMYELTKEEKWKNEAIKRTEVLDTIQYWEGNHDVGFIMNCSYGNGLKFGGQKQYEKVIIQSAESLSKRFNTTAKAIKSWNRNKSWKGKMQYYPVIIDNMMNLELLFEASKLSGNSKYSDIAIQHAETTMKNHYRSNYSSYHVVDYDTITGEVRSKVTAQGFADESSWARGQAWGLYGYTLCYRYTKDIKYLNFAENIAKYIVKNPNLPKDMIPFWDYNIKDSTLKPDWKYNPEKFKEIPRDASAAAVTASALFELAQYSKNKKELLKAANKILESLTSPKYMVENGLNKYFILDHCVGSIPHNTEIDVPLVYADYYLLEAMYRKNKIDKKQTI